MKLLVDEDTKANVLLTLLRQAGHDVVSTQDLGKDSAPDAEVFDLAQTSGRVILTKNAEDFFDLHEAQKSKGHFGVLVIFENGDPDKDMSYKDIVQAIANLEAKNARLVNGFQALNDWDWNPDSRP